MRFFRILLKLRYSKKVTKFGSSSTMFMTLLTSINYKWMMGQFFVAFSEYLKFTQKCIVKPFRRTGLKNSQILILCISHTAHVAQSHIWHAWSWQSPIHTKTHLLLGVTKLRGCYLVGCCCRNTLKDSSTLEFKMFLKEHSYFFMHFYVFTNVCSTNYNRSLDWF